jgi:hypothetical protein
MKRLFARLAGICSLGLLIAILPGCNSVEGGGFVMSATGAGKASFGFNLNCDGSTGRVYGEMVYIDHPLGLKAHLVPTSSALTSGGSSVCGGASGNGDFFGDYTASPPNDKDGNARPGGRFHVILHDGGEPGVYSGDWVNIQFIGGVFDGYQNNRPLLGGNIDRVE